ncbi:MucBP domain-containing protein [Levilactobacillus sp. HBUAS70063]|uniref:MucBP domain-containing protein n=1 Tax=Levilactobacillus sp. HBUAS70063 TaxID=3109359 RepID=UPI003132C501
MRNWVRDTKVHYKSYKAGKHWVVAGITAATLGLGMMGATETAQADEAAPNAVGEETASAQAAQPEQKATLRTPVTEVPAQEAPENEAPANDEQVVTEEPDVNPDETPQGIVTDDKPDVNEPAQPETPKTPETPTAPDNPVETPATPAPQQPATPQPEDVKGAPQEEVTPQTPAPKMLRAMAANVKASPIDGIDASEWIPDATLRSLIINQLNKQVPKSGITGQPYYVADDSNLYRYVGDLTSLYDYDIRGTVNSLEGLSYFQNLHTINLIHVKVASTGLIDFSVLPLLDDINMSLTADNGNHDFTTIMDTYFSKSTNLRFFRMWDSHLTGNIPDLSKYSKLEMVYLPNNNLTGSIPDLSSIPNLWSLMLNNNQLTGSLPDMAHWPALSDLDVSYNQLSGELPDIGSWPALEDLNVSYNNFTGALPDLSQFRGTLTYMFNRLTNGVVTLLGKDNQPIINYGVYQRLDGKTFKLSQDNQSFDPVSGVVMRMQDMTTGQPDENEGVWTAQLGGRVAIAYGDLNPNLPTTDIANWATTTAEDATGWFEVKWYGDQWGLTFTPKQDVPDGMYTIQVVNQSFGTNSNWGYSAYITFKIENEVPIDPDPGNPDPGVTTGTVTVINVDQDGNVISQSQQTGNVGDAFTINAPTLDGYRLVGDGVASGTYTAANQTITFTYQAVESGGDGDAVDPDQPAVDESNNDGSDVVTGGDGDQIAPDRFTTTKPGAATTSLKTATGAAAAQATTTKSDVATAKSATTLPQTDEATVSPWAGLALLLGGALTGLVLKRKRNH